MELNSPRKDNIEGNNGYLKSTMLAKSPRPIQYHLDATYCRMLHKMEGILLPVTSKYVACKWYGKGRGFLADTPSLFRIWDAAIIK
mmetsp:Transcript_8161/g.10370  ORF Transcript_8161/g.10370 Transcript_8161/m.10370 type:complete len:86 (+) Transcript_8161:404-661(+)